MKLTTQFGYPFSVLATALGEVINDTSDVSFVDYAEMLKKDETVASALEFFAYNVVNFLGEYAHPQKDLEDFVKYNFENLEESLERVLQDLVINITAYGFGVLEKVWEVKDGKLVLKKLVVLPSETCRFVLGEKGIEKVVQIVVEKGKIEIPREKTMIVRIGKGIYGESKLRRIWRAYVFKRALFKFWAVAMERYAMPVAHGKTVDVDTLAEKLKTLWSEGIIATDPETEISLLEPKNAMSEAYKEAIEYANILIYRGLLLPQLLAGSERVGSYALGRIHLDLFLSSVKRFASFIAENLIDQVVAQILEYNFGRVETYGQFMQTTQPTADELARLSQALNLLVNSGIVDPVSDNDWIRAMLGFPEVKEKEENEMEDAVWEALGRSLSHIGRRKTE